MGLEHVSRDIAGAIPVPVQARAARQRLVAADLLIAGTVVVTEVGRDAQHLGAGLQRQRVGVVVARGVVVLRAHGGDEAVGREAVSVVLEAAAGERRVVHHVVGTLDAVIGYLVSLGVVRADSVPHYRLAGLGDTGGSGVST